MQIQDLFIDAWVYLRIDNGNEIIKEPHKVTGMMTDTDVPCVQTDASDVYDHINFIEPIPLSPLIMSEIGFEEKDCDDEPLWSYEYMQYLVTFMSHNGCPDLTIEDVSGNGSHHNVLVVKDEIYNLHELQRAFMVFDIPCGFKLPKPF